MSGLESSSPGLSISLEPADGENAFGVDGAGILLGAPCGPGIWSGIGIGADDIGRGPVCPWIWSGIGVGPICAGGAIICT